MKKPEHYSVRDFGAAGDGVTLDTQAIQAAIDACAQNSGGTVWLPAGTYQSGSIELKSNVTLHLAAEARLLGSPQLADYAVDSTAKHDLFHPCLIHARDAHNIGLSGCGIIDGQGQLFPTISRQDSISSFQEGRYQQHRDDLNRRPMLINFLNCQGVFLADIHLANSGSWLAHFVACEDMNLTGVRIHNRVRPNNDGFDLESCRNVTISNCHILADDDAICLKSAIPNRPCENIAITNCIISSNTAAVKFGTTSVAGFKNIAVSNCTFYDCGLGAIKLLSVDGGELEDVVFSNIAMHRVEGPIFIRLGDRGRRRVESAAGHTDSPSAGTLRNVSFSNIRATVREVTVQDPMLSVDADLRAKTGILITGTPNHYVENITFSDVHITFPGGGTRDDMRIEVPENETQYPEQWFFGILPAYAAYVRHARGIVFNNVRFDLVAQDQRPAVMCDEVQDLEFSNFRAMGDAEDGSLIRLRRTSRVFIHGSRPLNSVAAFLSVEDQEADEVFLASNDLRCAKAAFAE